MSRRVVSVAVLASGLLLILLLASRLALVRGQGSNSAQEKADGNLYVAEVFNGRAQKFTPKKGADPAKLVGQQLRVAYKD
jgi:hypothetical protein